MPTADREEIHHAMIVQMDHLAAWYRSVRDHVQGLGAGTPLFTAIDAVNASTQVGKRYEAIVKTKGIVDLDDWMYASFDLIHTGNLVGPWIKAHDAYAKDYFETLLEEYRPSQYFCEYLKEWKFRMPEFLAGMIWQYYGLEFAPPAVCVFAEDFTVGRNRLATLVANPNPAVDPTVTNLAAIPDGRGVSPLKADIEVKIEGGHFIVDCVNYISKDDETGSPDAFQIDENTDVGEDAWPLFFATAAGALTAGQTDFTGINFARGNFTVGQTILIQGYETDSGNGYLVEELAIVSALNQPTSTMSIASGLLHDYSAAPTEPVFYQCFYKIDTFTADGSNAATSGQISIYPKGDRALAF